MNDADRSRYVAYEQNRNFGCRVSEFRMRGLRCVTLENELLRIGVAADKGADIYEFLYKPSDTELLLHTPQPLQSSGPISPTINLQEGAFLDFYEGGWQELFPTAGDFPCNYKGAQLGMHGEIALLPWTYTVECDSADTVEVAFRVLTMRVPFRIERRMQMKTGRAELQIVERVTNLGGEAMDFMWGHHPAFGWPFLEEGCRIEVPSCMVLVPASEMPPSTRLMAQTTKWSTLKGKGGQAIDLSVVPGPETGAHDMAFLHGFDEGWYVLSNPRRNLGFRLEWPAKTFPYLWFWQVTRGAFGYPWYGMTYNLALEPHSSFPPMLPKAIAAGTQLRLPAGGELNAQLLATVIPGSQP